MAPLRIVIATPDGHYLDAAGADPYTVGLVSPGHTVPAKVELAVSGAGEVLLLVTPDPAAPSRYDGRVAALGS